jgi:rubredoxin
VYDILCAKDFNPNERTGLVFSKGNPKILLPEQLRRAILTFYTYNQLQISVSSKKANGKEAAVANETAGYVYQCKNCMSVYDEYFGEPDNEVEAGTLFNMLPADYCCGTCEAAKQDFVQIEKKQLLLQAI